jgi:hypothetical protein
MRRFTPLLALVSAAAISAAPAAAQTPPAPTISAELARVAHDPPVALAGEPFVVKGKLAPAAAGQQVKVRLYRRGRKIQAVGRTTRADGSFRARLESGKSGPLRVVIAHPASPEIPRTVSAPVRLRAIDPRVAPGSHGPAVRFLQRTLWRHGYAVERTGRFGVSTSRAVLAFRKLTGRPRLALADHRVFVDALRGRGAFKIRYPKHGKHVEGDLTHQVMALIDRGGKVRRIYNISSGKASTPTVLGHFRVYSKQPGTNSHGMVHSAYFHGGYAIHGYVDVPTYPASHGCLRVPIPQALDIYNWIDIGDRVDVYYR